MNLFKSLVHAAALPLDLVADGIMLMADAADGDVLQRTRDRVNKIADPDREDVKARSDAEREE